MATLAFLLLFMAMIGASDGTWCVCRSDIVSSLQQKALDYACGAGADCNPVLQSGACYNPNTVLAHCSYATNSYYQRKNQAQGACDFSGAAVTTQTDPSTNGCTYPATPSQAATSGGGSTPNPSSTSSTGNMTPSSSGAGVLGGLGPAGTSTIDGSPAASLPVPVMSSSLLAVISMLVLVLLRVLL